MERLLDCIEQTPDRNDAITKLLNRDVIPVLPCEYDLIKEMCKCSGEVLDSDSRSGTIGILRKSSVDKLQIIDYPEEDYPTITLGSQVFIEYTDEGRNVCVDLLYISGYLNNIHNLIAARITTPIARLLLGKQEGDIVIPTSNLSLDNINNILGINIIKVTNCPLSAILDLCKIPYSRD